MYWEGIQHTLSLLTRYFPELSAKRNTSFALLVLVLSAIVDLFLSVPKQPVAGEE